MKITEIFAHRGACGYEPENTMEAFALAMEQGADGIELDVQLTKDGKLVIFMTKQLTGCVMGQAGSKILPWKN